MLQSLATKADNLSDYRETHCPLARALWMWALARGSSDTMPMSYGLKPINRTREPG